MPALPPPPPPTPPAFSYVHGSLSADRLVPVKSATLSVVKCLKINLVPAGMNTQALAIASFIIAHDTHMEVFLKMDDPTFDEWHCLGGAYAEWLVATDAMLANAILGSFECSSTHVQNFISVSASSVKARGSSPAAARFSSTSCGCTTPSRASRSTRRRKTSTRSPPSPWARTTPTPRSTGTDWWSATGG